MSVLPRSGQLGRVDQNDRSAKGGERIQKNVSRSDRRHQRHLAGWEGNKTWHGCQQRQCQASSCSAERTTCGVLAERDCQAKMFAAALEVKL
ncbi:hypothetical protein KCU65_g280, partial [Aureobasidium melanogenum]